MRERAYQTDIEARVRERMSAGVRALVIVMPTGSGKTVVAANLSKRVIANDRRIAFLVHRRELIRQTLDTIGQALPGVSVGVEAAGWPRMPWAPIQIIGVQSGVRRLERIDAPHVVFVDEGHHARARTWEKILAAWPDARIVMLTATPERLDGTRARRVVRRKWSSGRNRAS